jgi:hypothetical protein
MTNVFNNFSKEYTSQLLIAKYNNTKDKNISTKTNLNNTMNIYVIAFINYLKNNDTILYFGLILILLSLIIYIFNITIW